MFRSVYGRRFPRRQSRRLSPSNEVSISERVSEASNESLEEVLTPREGQTFRVRGSWNIRRGHRGGSRSSRGGGRPHHKDTQGDSHRNRKDQERFQNRFQHVRGSHGKESSKRRELAFSGQHKTTVHVGHMNRRTFTSAPPRKNKSPQFDQRYVHRLSIKELSSIAKCSSDEVVNDLNANLKGFQQSLNDCYSLKTEDSKDHYVNTVLIIIHKVSDSTDKETSSKILGEFLSERCSNFHQLLSEYVKKQAFETLSMNFRLKLSQLCKIFEMLLREFPASAWSVLPIEDLSEVSESLSLPEELVSKIIDLKTRRNQIREHFKQMQANALKKSVPKHIDNDDWDVSLYRAIPILPSIDEVCNSTPPILRSNIIQGSYKSWEHYYDVQFRLLREDFVAPLRRGIQSFLQGAEARDLHDINIYRNVQVLEPVFTRQGMCFKLSFDNSSFRKNWEHSKRLLYGSLLCLSPDGFKNEVHFCTVFERKSEDLDQGFFIAKFEDYESIFDHNSKKTLFLMAESRAYFEASCHILRSLQEAEVETMPFSKSLLKFDHQDGSAKAINPPQYLIDHSSLFDLKWLYNQSVHKFGGKVNILNQYEWPEIDDVELDQSQLDAIKMALTQEIAIIQGPPGTGKTYIGYKIVQTLLENREVWDPRKNSPILVMCFTNHALDQFLEGLLDCSIGGYYAERQPKIVRIGGRSKNEKIQKLNISNNKSWVPRRLLDERETIHNEIDECAKHMIWKSLMKTFKYPVNEFIVGPEGMKRLKKNINQAHFEQLCLLVNKKEDALPYALEFWLGLWQKSVPQDQKEKIMHESIDALQTVKSRFEQQDNETVSHARNDLPQEDEVVDVEGEAELEARERMLEDDQSRKIIERENKEEQLLETGRTTSHQKMKGDQPSILIQGKQRKPFHEIQKMLKQIQREEPMTEDEEMQISDIRDLVFQARRRLFRLWVQKYQNALTKLNRDKIEQYNGLCKESVEVQQQIDRYSLENAEVVGMTTTGAAKYQHIIHLVKPKIVIVEEAAELLESHIVSALNAGTQHLILIGDHKQLRPKPNEYDLAKKHNLHISLFERLIKNGLHHATLMIQHRMRPQIASLVCPHIYDKLENHNSVIERENIKGFDHNLFFFHHENEEEEKDVHLLSHSNDYEAEMVKALCLHILNQGYSPSQITILTAYTGQLLKVRKLMPKKIFEGVRIVNVDNFQGEENDIIILSLVRNNSFNKVGFLKEENRVCVALSRAKMGFYCFGNFKMLRNTVPIWEVILSDVESRGCLGENFTLHCHNHPMTKYTVRGPSEFQEFAPEGGCKEKCLARLDCGHSCTRLCHPSDPDHEEFQCLKPCQRVCTNSHPCPLPCHEKCKCLMPCPKNCPQGHPCKLLCHQPCIPCEVKVTRKITKCGHEQQMFCHEDINTFVCKVPCPNLCSNRLHQCPLYCGKNCKPCRVIVERIMPKCGHTQTMECHVPIELHDCEAQVNKCLPRCGHTANMPCHQSPSLHSCSYPCEKTLSCGHPCKRKCGEICTHHCEVPVPIVLKCGHEEYMPCYINKRRHGTSYFLIMQPKCSHQCNKMLSCGHQCKKKCGDICSITNCKELVEVNLDCGHSMTTECWKSHKNYRYSLYCDEPCNRTLSCGHQCKNKCGEPCSEAKCRVVVKTTLQCGHTIKLECWESCATYRHNKLQERCTKPCNKTLEPCGHQCPKKCGQKCPTQCSKQIRMTCSKGHTYNRNCFQTKQPCPKKCSEKLPCGHSCNKTCGEPCGPCTAKVEGRCGCGHKHIKECGNVSECSCPAKCTFMLKCGHICPGKCGQCYTTRVHAPCTQNMSFTPYCGHHVTTLCLGMEHKCSSPCQISLCPHSKKEECRHRCFKTCLKTCSNKCAVSCIHVSCTRPCDQSCDTKSCNEPCSKTLPCGHYCPGLCGEKCLLTCMTCSPKAFKENATGLGKKTRPETHQYIQLDCGHFFTVHYLDSAILGGHKNDCLVTPPHCPTCLKPMSFVKRYWLIKKQTIEDIKIIKQKSLVDLEEDQSAHRVRMEADSILYKYMTAKEKIRFEQSAQLISKPESLCLMKLVLIFEKLKVSRSILHLLTNLIVQKKGRLSEQLFIDLSSEVYRLCLSELVTELQNTADEDSPVKSKPSAEMKALGSVITLLQQMESNHNLRISEQQYLTCVHDLKKLGVSPGALGMSLDFEKPMITKGEWFKCSRAGHLYFASVGNRKHAKPHCDQC